MGAMGGEELLREVDADRDGDGAPSMEDRARRSGQDRSRDTPRQD